VFGRRELTSLIVAARCQLWSVDRTQRELEFVTRIGSRRFRRTAAVTPQDIGSQSTYCTKPLRGGKPAVPIRIWKRLNEAAIASSQSAACPRSKSTWTLPSRFAFSHVAVLVGVFDFGGDPAADFVRMRMEPPFGCSISKEFVLRTRSLSLRKPKVLGSKSEARLASCFPTSPSGTHPSSLSICVMTFLMMGVAALGG
jgi:hypothetical protein